MRKRIKTIAFTATFVFAIVLTAVSILTSPNYIPYSESLVSIAKNNDNTVTLTFDGSVTGYSVDEGTDSASGTEIYRIAAWDTNWDLHFTKRETQNMVVSTEGQIAIFYLPNDGSEDIFLYGTNPFQDGGTITLPRLVLGYYLFLALIASLLLGILWLAFRKKENIKIWIGRLFYMPVSYIIAHLAAKGLAINSYSAQRDFSIIILAAILIYFAIILGISLYRIKKEDFTSPPDCA